MSATVELAGERFELPVAPGKYVEDAYVSVLESKGKPRRVTGPAGVWPEGLDADAEAPPPVTAVRDLGPREFTPAEQAKLDAAVADLGVARDEIAAAVDQIGELATRVGFAWSGTFEATYPVGSDFRVDWTALGDGQFRFEMVNIPTGANFGWVFTLPDYSQQFPTTNPAIVTVAEPGTLGVYGWADDENVHVEVEAFQVRPEMMDSGPLQEAIAAAAQAAVTASRIAPRSLYDPTPADGVDRPKNALWTKVNAQGEELAYWSWDGDQWVPQALSRTVIPLLDASHISTGTLDSDRVNATEIWGMIATIGRIITEDLIAVGAVTAPALNVVHVDPTTGFGFRLDPEGLTILDQEGNPAIVLRSDMENYLSIVKDGLTVASISPDGEITGQTVSANQSLRYRGAELDDLIQSPQLGLVSQIGAINQNAPMHPSMRGVMTVNFTNRTSMDRVVKVTAKLQVRNRNDNMRVAFYGEASTTNEDIRATLGSTVRSFDDYGTTANGQNNIEHVQFFKNAPGQTWSVLVGARSNNTTTEQIVFQSDNTRMWAEDLGPWREPMFDIQTPDLRGDSTDGTGSKKPYTRTWDSTGHRTYSHTGLVSTRAGQSLVQGPMAGANSRGHWIFPDATIRSALAGNIPTSGTLTIRNQGTGSSSGVTAVLRTHAYSSAPATFGTSTPWRTIHVPPGGTVEVPITAAIAAGLANGDVRGFSLDAGSGATSSAYYGYFSPQATLKLNYTK